MRSHFRIVKSSSGYSIKLYCGDEPYLTYVDGMTQPAAERELQILTALWNGSDQSATHCQELLETEALQAELTTR